MSVRSLRLPTLLLPVALLLGACENTEVFGFRSADLFGGTSDSSRPMVRGAWVKPGDTDDGDRAAVLRECRQTAAAQIERDARVDHDRRVGSETLGTNSEERALIQSMDDYSQEKRRQRLFDSCMRERGYTKK